MSVHHTPQSKTADGAGMAEAATPTKGLQKATKHELVVMLGDLRVARKIPHDPQAAMQMSKDELLTAVILLQNKGQESTKPTGDPQIAAILQAMQQNIAATQNAANERVDAILMAMAADKKEHNEALAKQTEALAQVMDKVATLNTTSETSPSAAGEAGATPATKPQVRVPNPTIAPPTTLQEDVSLSDFEDWVQTWEDYTAITEMSRYPQPRQLGLFRSFLSPEMKETLEHNIGVAHDANELR